MKHPFEEYRAFSAYLVAIPEGDACRHLWECFVEGGKDNMAYYLTDFYEIKDIYDPLSIQRLVRDLKKDSKDYDLSGFKFISKKEKKS